MRICGGGLLQPWGSDEQSLPAGENLLELGLDSLMLVELLNVLKKDLQLPLYPRELYARPQLPQLAKYLVEELERVHGQSSNGLSNHAALEAYAPESVPLALPSSSLRRASPPARRNPSMVFVLSSPRAGSTLLRVMLQGHPALFAPPELHLLNFSGMREREQALGSRFLGEGLYRALMELKGLAADESKAIVDQMGSAGPRCPGGCTAPSRNSPESAFSWTKRPAMRSIRRLSKWPSSFSERYRAILHRFATRTALSNLLCGCEWTACSVCRMQIRLILPRKHGRGYDAKRPRFFSRESIRNAITCSITKIWCGDPAGCMAGVRASSCMFCYDPAVLTPYDGLYANDRWNPPPFPPHQRPELHAAHRD